jgi:hypothetical protein
MTLEQKKAKQQHNVGRESTSKFKIKRDELIQSIVKTKSPEWDSLVIKFFDYKI